MSGTERPLNAAVLVEALEEILEIAQEQRRMEGDSDVRPSCTRSRWCQLRMTAEVWVWRFLLFWSQVANWDGHGFQDCLDGFIDGTRCTVEPRP